MDAKELLALVDAATPGPWRTLPEEVDRDYIRVRGTALGQRYKIANVLTVVYPGVPDCEAEETRANAALIVAAVNALPALCAEVEAKDAKLAAEQEAYDGLADKYEQQTREVEALRKDAERLAYIERTFSGMTNRERYLPVQMIWGKGCNGRTLREACDKYMARDAAKEPK